MSIGIKLTWTLPARLDSARTCGPNSVAVTRLADPDDGRAAQIGITGHGQRLLDDRKRIRRERLTALLATLTSEEECALWLSARVAFPVLRRLVANADCPRRGQP